MKAHLMMHSLTKSDLTSFRWATKNKDISSWIRWSQMTNSQVQVIEITEILIYIKLYIKGFGKPIHLL